MVETAIRDDAALSPLRSDLRFVRSSESHLVVVHDLRTGAAHHLHEIDCLIALELSESRDLDDLTRRAQRYLPHATREQVAKVVREVAAVGLLEGSLARPVRAPKRADTADDPASCSLQDFKAFQTALMKELGTSPQLRSVPVNAQPPLHPVPPAPKAEPHDEVWVSPRASPGWLSWLRRHLKICLAVPTLGAIGAVPYPLYVIETCAVLPARRVEVRARVEGILVETLVDEGSKIEKGQVIARLEDRDLEMSLNRAYAEADRLRAVVAKMRTGSRAEEIARGEAVVSARSRALDFADVAAERQGALFAEHLGSAEDRDRVLRDRASVASELALAEADLRLLQAGFRREDVQAAAADLRRAEAEIRDLERKRDLLTITAPMAGVLVTPMFYQHLHERYTAGATLVEIADLTRARIEIYVPEREFDVLAVGQPATVKVRSFPLRPFRGTVEFLSLAAEDKEGERVVRAITEVDNTEGLLRENMTGYGEINTGKSHLALLFFRRFVRWIRLRFLI